MAHFVPCTESVTKQETANLFLHEVYTLRGLLRELVIDRDPKFVNEFGKHY
jgi:hypothetical protein